MEGIAAAGYLRDMNTLFDAGTAGGLSDRQLLERFAGGRDAAAEAAFEALVLRHGPMVMRVCRSTLGQEQADVHDAFQATFLVLVRKSQSIRRLDSVGSWLFGVASRVARRARAEAARRRSVERQGGLRSAASGDHGGELSDRLDLDKVIQNEVERLPDHLRAVVVLCYWEGLTHDQAAARLGCPLGTVRSRVARARDLLRRRLNRRGLEPVAGAMAAALRSPDVLKAKALEIPGSLVNSTVQAAKQVAAGGSLAHLTSQSVAELVRAVVGSMFMTKLRTLSGCLLLIGAGACGLTLALSRFEDPPKGRRDRTQSMKPGNSRAQPPVELISEYVIDPPDLVLVEVLEALPGRPISGERLVRPDGKISLGWYGDVYVAGKTVRQAKADIISHLQRFMHDEQLGLIQYDEEKDEPLIDPKTGEIMRLDPRDSDRVFFDVTAYNSKSYYVQGEVNGPGRFPITGQERVLDAIDYCNGLTADADHDRVFLYRQPPDGGPVRTLRIDIDQILFGDDLSTNYQFLAGDKLVVQRRRGESGANQKKLLAVEPDRQATKSESTDLERIDRRMDEMEQKLDQILESLKRPAGRAGTGKQP